ncbi:hypothetical protein JTB14_006959 [Gonioctena quinquepunctata]|nr:hypothetical protein JTB14_006959 [Gonioctena quinquepunctata]
MEVREIHNLPDDIIILEGDWMNEILNNNLQNDYIDPAGHLATNAFVADTSVDVAVKNDYLCDQNNPTIGSIEGEANNTKKSNETDLEEAENYTLLEKNQSQFETSWTKRFHGKHQRC